MAVALLPDPCTRTNPVRTPVLPLYLTSHLALTPGTRLGVHDITAAIGEGNVPWHFIHHRPLLRR
jgi:hypothetical protein